MDTKSILAALDDQISKLQQARAALTGAVSVSAIASKRGPGRPKKAQADAPGSAKPAGKKRVMSPEAKARIVAGQKKRWAAVRKAAKAADQSE